MLDETIRQLLSELSPLTYLLVFLGGVLTSLGPCNLSMVPVIMGYVGGQQDLTRTKGFRLSLFFTLGSSATFVLLGLFAALVGGMFGAKRQALYYTAAAVCLLIGANLLGAVKLNFDLLTRFQPKRIITTGSPGAFFLGLALGLTGSQCATPVLAAILTYVMAKGNLPSGAALLFAYGLGRGVPIVLAGTFTGLLRALPKTERWTTLAQKAAGLILLAVGLYFVCTA